MSFLIKSVYVHFIFKLNSFSVARCCPGWCRHCSWTSLCPSCQNSACKVINIMNTAAPNWLLMFKVFWISWSAHHHVIGRVNGIWTFLETFSLQPNGSQAILARKRVLNKHEINQINFTQEEEEQICSQKVQLSKRIGHIGEVKESWLLENATQKQLFSQCRGSPILCQGSTQTLLMMLMFLIRWLKMWRFEDAIAAVKEWRMLVTWRRKWV